MRKREGNLKWKRPRALAGPLPGTFKSWFRAPCCERDSRALRVLARGMRVRERRERDATPSHDCQHHDALQPLGGAWQRGCDVPKLCGGGQRLLLTWGVLLTRPAPGITILDLCEPSVNFLSTSVQKCATSTAVRSLLPHRVGIKVL